MLNLQEAGCKKAWYWGPPLVFQEMPGTVPGKQTQKVQRFLWASQLVTTALRTFHSPLKISTCARNPSALGWHVPDTEHVLDAILTLPTGTAVHLEFLKDVCFS